MTMSTNEQPLLPKIGEEFIVPTARIRLFFKAPTSKYSHILTRGQLASTEIIKAFTYERREDDE